MSKRLLVALVTLGLASSALSQTPPSRTLDVFNHSRVERPVADVRGLSPALRERVLDGRIASTEPRLGVPTFFWAARNGSSRSLRDIGLTASQAARRHLFEYGELYRQDPARISEARIAQVHDTGDGAVIVAFQQDEGGVRVFRDELKVVMNQRLELVAISGYLSPERKHLGGFLLTPQTAIAAAYRDLSKRPLESSQVAPTGKVLEADYQQFTLDGQEAPVRARKVFFPTAEGLEPGFYVELQLSERESTGFDYFSYVVSARDGRLLFRHDLTRADAFNYRVWADGSGSRLPFDGPQGNAPSPHPTGTPNQFAPAYVPSALVTLQNGPISTNDPWLPATAVDTRGNNASAYADIAAPNGFTTGDLRATVTAAKTFDRTYDVAQSPGVNSDQRMAAITQLFYNVNLFHDWYYDVGFDEKSGNGQNDNYGRGGLSGDALYAEAQDYSGKNNANMSTPSDGAHPVMQMYVFDGAVPLKIHVNGALAKDISAGTAEFGPQVFGITADIQYIDDGDPSGTGGSIHDGCQAFTATGKIALVDRGNCTFVQKAQNAQTAGAVGLIIANNSNFGGANALVGTAPGVSIPSVSVSKTDGAALEASLATTTVNVTVTRTQVTDLDGTIDNSIVAHEWGHYISNRLIGDGNGLSSNQDDGMGEGWADFHAMLMVVKEGDDLVASNANFNGVYAMAGYSSFGTSSNGYYFGIRRVPYSTNLQKNGLTFKHVQDGVRLPSGVATAFGSDGSYNSEAHNTGEVWATMLWECYASLLRDTPRLSFTEANQRMRAYLVAAYKGTPLNPNMIEARDAVLAAAAAKDPIDFANFSAAFAKRGMGMTAVAPPRDSDANSPVTESFITGNGLAIASVKLDDSVTSCDHDGILDNAETGKLTITVKNVGTGELHATTAVVTTTSPNVVLGNGGMVSLPTTQPFGTLSFDLDVGLKGVVGSGGVTFVVSVVDPSFAVPGAVKMTVPFRVNFDARSDGSSLDDVESPTSLWTSTADPNGSTASNWRRFEASATEHYWFGPNPSSPADTWLTSPSLKIAATGNFVLTFKHRWDFEGSPAEYFDGGVVEISTNGGATWSDVGPGLSPAYNGTLSSPGSNPLAGRKAFVGQSPGYPAFLTQTVDLGGAYAGKTVKLRFRIGSDDAAALKGWELDDLNFAGLGDKPFPTVLVDPNSCSNGAPLVTLGPDQVVEEGAEVTLAATATDSDSDPLTFTWTQVTGPAVTLTGGAFTAPAVDADTTLTFELSVTDGKATVGPLTSTVLVRNLNNAPIAVAPANLEVTEGGDVTLTGSGTDPDGDAIVGYQWRQVSGPTVSFDALDAATVHFVAPQILGDTRLTFALVVSDGTLDSVPSQVEVLVRDTLAPPVSKLPGKKSGCGCDAGAEGVAPLLTFALLALAGLKARRRR